MRTFELLVIGSGPAGIQAAASYAEAGGPGPVAIVSADVDEPYMRPPLSKDSLAGGPPVEPTPIGPAVPKDAELLLGRNVTAIDLEKRTVTAGDETLGFRRLVVATGAVPTPFPEADADAEIHLLRSLEDARCLTAAAKRSTSAVVIGSGFIGCEAAASLGSRGVDVTLVTPEDGPQTTRLGDHASRQITSWLTDLGVEIRTGVQVTHVDAPRTVHLDDGTTLAPDMILSAIGMQPAAGDLGDPAGLQTYDGRLVADERLSVAPGVWVAGDSARGLNVTAGRSLDVEHWGDALAMGDLVGRNAAATDGSGEETGDGWQPWSDVPGFFSEIGEHTLQYAAWGDGHERAEVVERTGGFTVWYADADDVVVGVLTYNADDDYERGSGLVAQKATLTEALSGARPDEDDPEGDSGDGDA
ncbi:NAD(P)/FAD-dependent oxidoreductase [Mobilicoccus pelagius]|uniref:Putative ferredoxin reductase n=1 Tax=Mobilicoccus pelagius NBRC 104925 TaxID=1089455 RepID=H5UVN1_9MICO|nr:NAD(P)/FAD-dependent oxidoreductase [Mobilicoccus pelagius]GAB49789.1 putative ferredoxin reductase [Mobilicoccus pelagius NBRC 104925]